MSVVTSSASGAISALFGTITTTSNTVVKTINNAANAMDMLSAYVDQAKSNQAASYKMQSKDNLRRLVREASLKRAQSEEAILVQLDANPQLKLLYKAAEADYEAMFPELATATHP